MKLLSVKDMAKKWGVSERSVRGYCAADRIPGAVLSGKTWKIPENAVKPDRLSKNKIKAIPLLEVLRREKETKLSGGIYHRVQIELTYNSNHIEGSRLSKEQTRFIFETNTIGVTKDETFNVDDIVETANHFKCIDMVIDKATAPLSEKLIKQLHQTLKNGTSDSRKDWFAVGEYKKLPNEVGGIETTSPEKVTEKIRHLLKKYNQLSQKTLHDLIDFHVQFEKIHPFQDGNGRIGRLLLFKECLRYQIVPFIITDEIKLFYYRGLQTWQTEPGYLMDTCLSAQDYFKKVMDYFRISYE